MVNHIQGKLTPQNEEDNHSGTVETTSCNGCCLKNKSSRRKRGKHSHVLACFAHNQTRNRETLKKHGKLHQVQNTETRSASLEQDKNEAGTWRMQPHNNEKKPCATGSCVERLSIPSTGRPRLADTGPRWMEPSDAPRKPRANSRATQARNSTQQKNHQLTGARKNVVNQRNNATIMPAPETLQGFPRQEAARMQHREITREAPITTRGARISTHRDPLNPQGEGCSGARRTTETRHRRGSQTSQCRQPRDRSNQDRITQGCR